MTNIYETLSEQIILLNKSADELMDKLKSDVDDSKVINEEWLRVNSKYLMFKAIANKALKDGFNSTDPDEVRLASNIIINEKVYLEKDKMINYLMENKSSEFVAVH